MPEATIAVSDAQVGVFRDNGYLVIESLTTQEEVATLREIYDRLFESQAGRDEGNQYDLAGPGVVLPITVAAFSGSVGHGDGA